ncbi:hypothetical protein fugu_000827 [Takifugu bimaculatus]|uniref:Uncharacterized protein n=1 Tax=Takifugu bimaculatus TaxID=433685 RepID=A0A4Z2CHT4_9TELE|nr:hypothetical protein fugu_000827 [Takifugu bimaculatus]
MENKIEGRKAVRRRRTESLQPSIIHEASERARVRTSRSKASCACLSGPEKDAIFPLPSRRLRDKSVELTRRSISSPHVGTAPSGGDTLMHLCAHRAPSVLHRPERRLRCSLGATFISFVSSALLVHASSLSLAPPSLFLPLAPSVPLECPIEEQREPNHCPALDSILLINGQHLVGGHQRFRHAVDDSFSLTGAPLGVWRKMERGGESPVTQDSPERRGGSPDLSSLPPPGKKGRLDLNGSPNGPRVRHNGASSRPQGGRV